MAHRFEKEVRFSTVTVQLATVTVGPAEQISPPYPDYFLCQRLSDNHSPLRIGDVGAPEAFLRVRSVGFLPPGCPVRIFPFEAPFRMLNCVFDKRFFENMTEITPDLWNEHSGALVSIRNKRLEILMQEIYVELVQPGFAHNYLIEAASTLLLVELARYARQLEKKSSKYGAGLTLAPWQLRRIQERIEASLEMGYPNLSELADLCVISTSHLMRTFKESTGWQIHKYIAEERLNAAKRMLAEDQISAKEIAAKLGFQNSSYFATAFRRMTGKTPSEYRGEIRAKGVVNF